MVLFGKGGSTKESGYFGHLGNFGDNFEDWYSDLSGDGMFGD